MSDLITIKSRATGKVKSVTTEAWETIKNNGFGPDFEVLKPPAIPQEVVENLKGKKTADKAGGNTGEEEGII